MSSEYEVRYDPVALEALGEATRFIVEDSSVDRALAWLDAMRQGIGKLETHPRAYPAVSLRGGRPVHSKLVVKHRVFYFIDDLAKVVYVLDVVHTARDSRLDRYRGG